MALVMHITLDTGRGVAQDFDKAVEWCEKAAAQGNAQAPLMLQEVLASIESKKRDAERAMAMLLAEEEQHGQNDARRGSRRRVRRRETRRVK